MNTDTPRTDSEEYTQDDSNPPEKLGLVDADFARQLERELSAATARIAKLENAGDRLENHLGMEIELYVVQDAIEAWNKARHDS